MSMLPTPPSPLSPMMAALEGREYTNQLPTLQQQPSTCQQQQSPSPVKRRYAPMRSHKSQSAEHLPTRIEQLKPPSPTATKPRSSSFDTSQPHKAIRRRSSFCPQSLHATILFLDLEGYSKSSDIHQRQITSDFMTTLRNLLIFIYNGIIPERGNIDNYVILPTGDGAAVIVIKCPCCVIENTNNCNNDLGECCSNSDNEEGGECSHEGEGDAFNCTSNRSRRRSSVNDSSKKKGIYCKHCNTTSLQTTEETALWIGSTLLLWATQRQIGLRVGLNSGELNIVEDPYGDPNVCGDAINMAARIMDTALPGQILASASTVVPNLKDLQSMNTSFDELDVGREDIGLSMDELDIGRTIKPRRRRERIKQDDDCIYCPRMKYEISQKPSEVVVKHGVTTNVQSITCTLHPLPRPEDLPPELLEGTEPPLMPSSSLIESESLEDNDQQSSQLHPHPLLKIKNNPKKLSFASLSSLQHESLRGSIRGSMRGSIRDSFSDNKPSGSLNSDSNHNGGGGAQTRMSMLSQLSNVSNDESDIAESMRTANTSNMSSPQSQHRKQLSQLSQQSQQSQTPFQVGNHKTPATKWYMKIKPTEMQSSGESGQIKPKVLPQELIRRHQRIAFLGIMHDNLSKGFVNILDMNPNHRWEQVYILFPSDECLMNHLAHNYRDQSVDQLIYNKKECRKTLLKLLSPVVDDLRFLQYDQLMHCGSNWDWRDPGGFIHISPLTWGANPKTCPAMNYYWNSRVPSPEYRVYREGLGYLLDTAKPFDDTVSLEDTIHEDEREQSSSSIEEQT